MADRQASALPAPRDVLSGLIVAIAATPAETTETIDTTASALASASLSKRKGTLLGQQPLLATLHVLFPALLLPALDLLDRRRVVRWGERRQPSSLSSIPPPLYQIRGGGDRPHVVHLRAWHCTCAFFALQAAASMPSAMTADVDVDVDVDNEGQQHPLKDALAHFPLAFSTPPCKHLLACLLAEEWAALGDYVVAGVDHAAVGDNVDGCAPETLAGIVAGVL